MDFPAAWAQAGANTQYAFRQGALACRLRAALTCLVHDKALLVSAAHMAAFDAGAVQTLQSVDADRVVNLFGSLHELWSLPLQIAAALCLLYTQARGSDHAREGVVHCCTKPMLFCHLPRP